MSHGTRDTACSDIAVRYPARMSKQPSHPSYPIDETHDPKMESWVESANDPSTDFPIQNLPLAMRLTEADDGDGFWAGIVVAVGDELLDLNLLAASDIFDDDDDDWNFMSIEDLMADGLWSRLRPKVQRLLRKDDKRLRDHRERGRIMSPAEGAVFALPLLTGIGDYTDFYASIYHATNVGSMFRPENPLLPNYKWIPIGYHGRASSIVASGAEIRRPMGQTVADGESEPKYGACKRLDYELEIGAFIARGNEQGDVIPIDEAEEHLFGICLVNDWSARDMQKWEYQPLGPFLAKSFATTISPFIVTMEALTPFRCGAFVRDKDDPKPLAYLRNDANEKFGGIDMQVEALISSKQMRDKGMEPVRVSRTSFRHMYWTIAQMLTHHASNGCNMQAGDLIASGTVSGPGAGEAGCLLEATWKGAGKDREPIKLPTGETRFFLADGDEVILRGWCEREGFRRIGLGECRGVVTPAKG